MNKHRSLTKLAALAIAVSAALPALPALADTVTVERGTHHYIYYRDHDIYFAPETRTYYWLDNGRWQSGPVLPEEVRGYVGTNGVDIQLDTDRPYERNDYVVTHYKDGPPVNRETTTTERTTSDNGVTSTTTTTTTTKHRYVYYGDHDIYFSPETKTYYWLSGGRWRSGNALPVEMEPYLRNEGVAIELDTDRPYDRNDYVIAHYKHRHDHDRDDNN